MRFKEYLINEQRAYLGQKVGDILTAAQELRDDARNMDTRDLTRFSERIVNQIRRILHSNWPREEKKHLKTLQKVGVAIMKSIEDRDDLPGTVSGAAGELEKLVADLGVPIHKLATTDKAPTEDDDSGTDKPEKNQSTPPPKSFTIDKAGPVPPPTGGTGQDMYAPPLGGSSGPMDAF
jgi:hypothetical protein